MANRFGGRVRFNWGFHDATRDASAGKPRLLVDSGPQDIAQVSREHSPHYHAGYAAGLAAMEGRTERPESSQPAWLESGLRAEGCRCDATHHCDACDAL